MRKLGQITDLIGRHSKKSYLIHRVSATISRVKYDQHDRLIWPL